MIKLEWILQCSACGRVMKEEATTKDIIFDSDPVCVNPPQAENWTTDGLGGWACCENHEEAADVENLDADKPIFEMKSIKISDFFKEFGKIFDDPKLPCTITQRDQLLEIVSRCKSLGLSFGRRFW